MHFEHCAKAWLNRRDIGAGCSEYRVLPSHSRYRRCATVACKLHARQPSQLLQAGITQITCKSRVDAADKSKTTSRIGVGYCRGPRGTTLDLQGQAISYCEDVSGKTDIKPACNVTSVGAVGDSPIELCRQSCLYVEACTGIGWSLGECQLLMGGCNITLSATDGGSWRWQSRGCFEAGAAGLITFSKLKITNSNNGLLFVRPGSKIDFSECWISALTNSNPGNGAVLSIAAGLVTFKRCLITSNVAFQGGVVYMVGGEVKFSFCRIISNFANVAPRHNGGSGSGMSRGLGGVLWISGGTATFSDCPTIANNGAESAGSVIFSPAADANVAFESTTLIAETTFAKTLISTQGQVRMVMRSTLVSAASQLNVSAFPFSAHDSKLHVVQLTFRGSVELVSCNGTGKLTYTSTSTTPAGQYARNSVFAPALDASFRTMDCTMAADWQSRATPPIPACDRLSDCTDASTGGIQCRCPFGSVAGTPPDDGSRCLQLECPKVVSVTLGNGVTGSNAIVSASLALPPVAYNVSTSCTLDLARTPPELFLEPKSGEFRRGVLQLPSTGLWEMRVKIGSQNCTQSLNISCSTDKNFVDEKDASSKPTGRCKCKDGYENRDGECVLSVLSPCDAFNVSLVGTDGHRQVMSDNKASANLTDASTILGANCSANCLDPGSTIVMSPTEGTREASIYDTTALLQRGQTPIGSYKLLLRGSYVADGINRTCLKEFGVVRVDCAAGSSKPPNGTVCLPSMVVNSALGDVRLVTSSGLNVSDGSSVEAGEILTIVVDAYDSARNRISMVDHSNRTIRTDIVLTLQLYGQLNTPKAPRSVQLLPDTNHKNQLMATVLESWIREQEPIQSAPPSPGFDPCRSMSLCAAFLFAFAFVQLTSSEWLLSRFGNPPFFVLI